MLENILRDQSLNRVVDGVFLIARKRPYIRERSLLNCFGAIDTLVNSPQ